MSDKSFNPVIVRDSRINDISTQLEYAVHKGASQNNYQQIEATSKDTTSINFQVTPPSENIVIDRNVTITNDFTLRVVIGDGVPDTEFGFLYGGTEALNQFPFNSLCKTSTCTINECHNSVNTQDMLHTLVRMYDDDEFSNYDCPTMSDNRFKKYPDMALSHSNPLWSYLQAKGKSIPRGAHPIKSFSIQRYNGAGVAQGAPATTEAGLALATTSTHATDNWIADLRFETTEPLLFLSPFIFGKSNHNNAGIHGVRSMNFSFNLDTQARRVFCSGRVQDVTVSLTHLHSSKLNLNYLSVQASDLLHPRNVVPQIEYFRTIQSGTQINAGVETTVNTSALQFSQLPNKIYIVVRKPINTLSSKDSNSFLPIKSITINFNNVSGILSGATPMDLYKMSVANGSKQDKYEFLGYAMTSNIKKPTIGSILIIDPSRDLNLPDYLSNGSTGQFSFQANITFTNTEDVAIVPEIMIITENAGVFITEAGQSMKQSGLLTKEIVMDATMSQFGESSNYIKSFGQNCGDNLNPSNLKNIPLLNFKKSGSGAKSGGAMSGGGAMSIGSKLMNMV